MTREFVTALQFLTRIRLFRDPDYDDGLFGRSVKFFRWSACWPARCWPSSPS